MSEVSVAPSQEGAGVNLDDVRKSLACVDSALLKTIDLSNNVAIISPILKRLLGVNIVDIKDKNTREQFHVIDLSTGEVLNNAHPIKYVITRLDKDYTQPLNYAKNVFISPITTHTDLIIFSIDKPAFIVVDEPYHDLKVTILKWNGDGVIIKDIEFYYDDGSKDEMLDYVKTVINAIEPYV